MASKLRVTRKHLDYAYTVEKWGNNTPDLGKSTEL